MEWMLMPLNRYAEFGGRSCRMEYWMYTLFQTLVLFTLVAIFFVLFGFDSSASDNDDAVFGIVFALAAYLLIFFVPNISVTVRRFHDQGLSGWLYLLSFIPYLGALYCWFSCACRDHRVPTNTVTQPIELTTA